MNLVLPLAAAILFSSSIATAAGQKSTPPVAISTADLTATDSLGRTLPDFNETGPPRPNRTVGIFYWQWHSDDRWGKNYNITEFLKTHPNFRDFQAHPAGGPDFPTWYWAEPLFGYYRSTDPWVIRKHLVMLSDAGIDFLFLDYTNGSVYDKELATLLSVAEDLKRHHVQVPKLVFFLNSQPEWKIESLYTKWYKPGKYDDMWFRWQGKPLMMSPEPTDASKLKNPALLLDIQNAFTWRPTWAFHDDKTDPTKWRFLESFQPDGSMRNALGPNGKIEQAVVSKSLGGPLWNNMVTGGVSCKPGFVPTYDDQWTTKQNGQGIFFQAQWDHAEKVSAPILLVTGWNEWTASVWETPGVVMLGRTTVKGQGHIVDEFNMDFDRDLEPMRGGYGDNYYWQLVANMRRYKGMLPPQKVSGYSAIRLNGPPSQWNNVTPIYRDPQDDIGNRDFPGCTPNSYYKDDSARNDIVKAQVARTRNSIAFRVVTASPLTPPSGTNWMNLLIDRDNNHATGWNGYDLLVGRFRRGGKCSLEINMGSGWDWRKIAMVPFHFSGRELTVIVPRSIVTHGEKTVNFGFKWADNLPNEPTVYDFYTKGDVAPDSRFNYHYRAHD